MNTRESFMQDMPIKEDEVSKPVRDLGSFSESLEILDPHERACEIAGQGNYGNIVAELSDKNLLEGETAKVQAEYFERLQPSEEFGFTMTEKDWEMLTVLGLYDYVALEHCVHTFELAKEKLEEELVGPDGSSLKLAERFEADVDAGQFLRACLMHDIGKVEVPRFAIKNTMPEEEWERRLLNEVRSGAHPEVARRIGLLAEEYYSDPEIIARMHARGLRPKDLLPVIDILSAAEIADLRRRNIDPDTTTLEKIIETHERSSHDILSSAGCTIEAEIAGHHHNYAHEELKYPVSTEALRSNIVMAGGSLVDILHLADVEEALTSKNRPYKKSFTLPHTLEVLIDHQRLKLISPELTYLWVKSEFKKIDQGLELRCATGTEDASERQECRSLTTVHEFLGTLEGRYALPDLSK